MIQILTPGLIGMYTILEASLVELKARALLYKKSPVHSMKNWMRPYATRMYNVVCSSLESMYFRAAIRNPIITGIRYTSLFAMFGFNLMCSIGMEPTSLIQL